MGTGETIPLKFNWSRTSILDFFSLFVLAFFFIFVSSFYAQSASDQRLLGSKLTQTSTLAKVNDTIPTRFQGKIVRQVDLKNSEKVIALTFDDGPVGDTSLQVLEILEQYQVKATFFWVGENLQQFPYIGRAIARQGHAIGNHTWSHFHEGADNATIAREIEETSTLISELTGSQTRLFRPPLGDLENGLVTYAQKQDYAVILWSIDSGDGVGYPGVKTIVNNAVNNAHPGGIVLLHDAPWYRQKTVAALPEIIERLRSQDYSFVTIPELLTMSQ